MIWVDTGDLPGHIFSDTHKTSLWLIRRIWGGEFFGFCLVYGSIYRTVYCPIDLSVGLSIVLSIHQSIYLSFYLSLYLSIYRPIYRLFDLSFDLSIVLSIDRFIFRTIYCAIDLSIDLSIVLSIYLFGEKELNARSEYCNGPLRAIMVFMLIYLDMLGRSSDKNKSNRQK